MYPKTSKKKYFGHNQIALKNKKQSLLLHLNACHHVNFRKNQRKKFCEICIFAVLGPKMPHSSQTETVAFIHF